MIAALIIILLIILFLAFFVGKNLLNVCTLWLFKTYSEVSVTVVVFIAFAAGIIFSILCYLIAKFIKLSHENEIADAKDYAKKQQKKDEKQQKKLARHASKVKPAPELKSKTSVESASETTDKVVNIEDRIHD